MRPFRSFNIFLFVVCAMFLTACGGDEPDVDRENVPAASTSEILDVSPTNVITPSPTESSTNPTALESLPTATQLEEDKKMTLESNPDLIGNVVLLTSESSPEEILERVKNPIWNTMWVRGVARILTPNGEAAESYVQAWLNREGGGQVIATDYLIDASVDWMEKEPYWLWVSDGNILQTYTLPGGSHQSSDTNWFLHPLEMAGPVLEIIFPRSMAEREVASGPLRIDNLAGREVVMVEGWRSRFWIDAVSGVILKTQWYQDDAMQILTNEIIIEQIAYDIAVPESAYLPYYSLDAGFIEQEQYSFDHGPAPLDFDASQSRFMFKSVMLEDSTGLTGFLADIFADQYYLVTLDSGMGALLSCTRSPVGNDVTFLYKDEQGRAHLRWVHIEQAGEITVIDPLPDLELFSSAEWSPDGNYLLFSARENETFGVYVYDVWQDEFVYRNDQYFSSWPMLWSPDGSMIAFLNRNVEKDEGVYPLLVIEVDSGDILHEGIYDWEPLMVISDGLEWEVDIPQMNRSYERCIELPGD